MAAGSSRTSAHYVDGPVRAPWPTALGGKGCEFRRLRQPLVKHPALRDRLAPDDVFHSDEDLSAQGPRAAGVMVRLRTVDFAYILGGPFGDLDDLARVCGDVAEVDSVDRGDRQVLVGQASNWRSRSRRGTLPAVVFAT